jgi:cytochrome P450
MVSVNANRISFMDPEVQKCPFPAYRTVREAGPVFVDPATGWFVITDYNLVRTLTADTTNLSSFTGILMCKQKSAVQDKLDKIYAEEGYTPVPLLVVADPPEHKFHRSFVERAFTAARVKKLEAYLEGVVDEMIDQCVDLPEVEFRGSLAARIPQVVIGDLLGMPRSDLPKLKIWTDAVIANQDQSNSEERQVELAHVICELHRYAVAKVAEYRKSPAECLLSDFANTKVDGRELTSQEVAALCEQVMAGGNDSSANAIANAMLRLIDQPDLQAQLRDEPELIPRFVEEVLRLDAPVQGLFREPKQDMEIAGVKIPKGSVVVLKWGAANRDPAQFPNPDAVDLQRPNGIRHMTFGNGPHVCVGNQLARGEIRIVIAKILQRVKNLRYSRGRDSVVRDPHFFAWGPRELYITFDRVQ